MSSRTKDERLESLLAQADEASAGNELAKAATILREAVQLDAENPEVKKRWLRLAQQQDSNTGDLDALRKYLASGRDEDAKTAFQNLRSKLLTGHDAHDAFQLLTSSSECTKGDGSNATEWQTRIDDLTSILLDRNVEVRKIVVAKFIATPTDIFSQLYGIGDGAFKAVLPIVLDKSLWPDSSKQIAAQQDIFRLCSATLIEAGIERPERAMRAITRLLAVAPENVASLLDQDEIDILLTDLDIRLDQALRRQAMLATSKMLEVTKEKGEEFFATFVTRKVAGQTNVDLILAFSAAAAVFPILPAVAAKLFLTDGFVQQLVPNLEKNSEEAAHGRRKSQTLEQAALELLSAACVDKACREAIKRYCSHWLQGLSDERQGHHKALASLILAKTSDDSIEDVTTKLTGLVIHGDEERDQAVEGLAYTSMQPKIKQRIAADTALLKSLVTALKERKTAMFGCLTVFSNITSYKAALSEEQKKMTHLHAYANSSKLAPDDPLDDEKYVTARCKKLLEANAVSALVASCQQTTSPSNIALVVMILLPLAKDQKHRPKMAQQGAVKLLLQIRDRTNKTDKSTSEAATIEKTASHALARLLISVNPQHVFSSGLPASSAVAALTPLLTLDPENETRDLLPTFEALLALTNLASMSDSTARDQVIRTAFAAIEDLLFSRNTLVQRGSVELVCNLMASPHCIALFADGSPDSKRRLLILLALADVEDLATRKAAGGAFAALTEWDVAVTAVLDVKEGKGIKALLGMCEDENLEVVHRGLVCLGNLVSAPGEVGVRGKNVVKEVDGVGRVREVLRGVKDMQVLGVGVEVLKALG
ncbi:SWI5-dependent HO expression protein 4 [Recurvomyces mirabilis]|uniref:SWI5-dependent HO expression protein 4 n=1 Tax=Recurvomyces mirabilis TaxID=574656 RepID=A0AAE0WU52_9PEZI|nr:SWI5-dependent HO expression protein 4 [Recurvomyces mirabilis]KAK5160529.1 SWI5-dependent HO expression protein 4 [Recurvomyces mirabilis]